MCFRPVRVAEYGKDAEMTYLLNIVYLLVAIVVSPILVWRSVQTGKYRSGWSAKLFGNVPSRDGDAPCAWLHAVSVGEVNLLTNVVKRLAQARPDMQIVISTTTATGMQLARSRFPDHCVFYCPLDFSWAVRRAFRRIRPNVLVLSELELWPNLICIARQKQSEVVVLNARLSERSFRGYRRVASLLRPTFRRLSLVLAQDETYARRFLQLGVDHSRIRVTGSIKFDGARTDRHAPDVIALRKLSAASKDQIVWIAGSTQSPEERIALDVYRRLSSRFPQLRLVLVPRHPERFHAVADQVVGAGMKLRRRSELQTPAESWPSDTVLLVDTIGELGCWWGLADIAFVGGSMGSRGGQNMLEPAGFGAAVSFGPNTKNFRDIVAQLLAADAATVVNDKAAMEQFVSNCIENPVARRQQGQRAQVLVVGGQGAIDRTISVIEQMLPPVQSIPARHAA
ncbi:3-deoxy-D-manno-octulosonic acid transferase [Rosistilla carotiformis]|uniref:3-deoxy-D-manno-octulosonic acid transferase n=1 Tax=Rosistilla carotiformis TaxID=2528017 RepID=A0A518JXK9_9BACT|nr:3-deoxy-D-manno-octulosonic acid transferase [Rosistilla carotiformis]QDV70271.1 3-deoxy-D-manno-octulosonic acid transferase [Rosistilla carotiformis]